MAYEFAESIQRGILYLYKSDRDFHVQANNLIKEEYFESEVQGRIFKVVNEYFTNYKKLPQDDYIIEEVRKLIGKGKSVEDYSDELIFISKIDKQSLNDRDYLLDKVEEFSKREALKIAISESIQLIKDGNFNAVESLVKSALLKQRHVDVGQFYFEGVLDRYTRKTELNDTEVLPCVFKKINDTFNYHKGIARKELAMVVANPGVGKSIYLVNQGVVGLMHNKKVLHISLEMSQDRCADRYDSVMTHLSQTNLHTKVDDLQKRLALFKNEFPGSELLIKEFPTGRANVNSIRALLGELETRKNFVPDVLIVDYLELLRPLNDSMQEYQAQQRVAEELRGLAVEYNLALWTATQPNRDGTKVQVITEAELADSYGKIRTVDLAISLNQTLQEFEQGLMRVYIIKNRNGKPKVCFNAAIDYNILVMKDLTSEED